MSEAAKSSVELGGNRSEEFEVVMQRLFLKWREEKGWDVVEHTLPRKSSDEIFVRKQSLVQWDAIASAQSSPSPSPFSFGSS